MTSKHIRSMRPFLWRSYAIRMMALAAWGGLCTAGGIPVQFRAVRRSKSGPLMSALGQKQTWRHHLALSALSPEADMPTRQLTPG